MKRFTNYFAGYRDKDSSLFFGTVKGLVYFEPDKFSLHNTSETNVFITSVHIPGKGEIWECKKDITPQKQQLELDYKQSTFNINFSTLSYIAPDAIQYAYRMMGMSEEWNKIGTRNTIYFENLHPGKYTLELKASDIFGNWSHSIPILMNITIRPPWWASTEAYIIYLLCVIGIICWIIRFWLHRQKKSMMYEMQLFESRKEKELYQAKIDFFSNVAHEIRTPLTLIRVPLEKMIKHGGASDQDQKSLTLMEKNVSRLIELVNQLLDFRKAETEGGNLTFVNVEIVSLIKEIADQFQEAVKEKEISLNLDLSIQNLIVNVDKEGFTKILSNLFSNAIKYASALVIVNIRVSNDLQNFIIDFINDGKIIPKEFHEKIFEPFYRINENSLNPGTGLGLPLTRFLVEKHCGTIIVAESSSEKTIFRVSVPIKQTNVIKSISENYFTEALNAEDDHPYEIDRTTLLY